MTKYRATVVLLVRIESLKLQKRFGKLCFNGVKKWVAMSTWYTKYVYRLHARLLRVKQVSQVRTIVNYVRKFDSCVIRIPSKFLEIM